jgi:predicted DNA-binding protein
LDKAKPFTIAQEDEVEQGLKRLSRDIAGGSINEVIESYRNENGDYLFIAAEMTSP